MARRKKADKVSWTVLGVGIVGLFALIGATKSKTSSGSKESTEEPSPLERLLSDSPSSKNLEKDLASRPTTTNSDVSSALLKNTTDRVTAFTPQTVTLIESVSFPPPVGLRPPGTKVSLKAIKQDKIVVEINGVSQGVFPTSTDLLDQMVQASENSRAAK